MEQNRHTTTPYQHNSRRHHHHNDDSASKFKHEALTAIRRRKMLKRVSFITLVIIAILMFCALIWVYTA